MNVAKLVKLLIPHDPSSLTYISEDGINVNMPKALINDRGNQIEVVEYSTVAYILEKLEAYSDNEILKLYTYAKEQVTLLSQDKNELMLTIIKERDEYEEAINQNSLYTEWYGKAVSPFSILNQLYRLKKGAFQVLVPKNKWQKYGKDEASKYWIEMFQYWKIIRIEGNHKYFSLLSINDARDLLFTATSRQQNSIDVTILNEYNKDSK